MSLKYSVKRSAINTLFYLNNSYSKFLTVGLQEDPETHDFHVTVGLGGSQMILFFNVDEWHGIQDNFVEIMEFFDESDKVRWRKPIVVSDKINITFTTSFNSKSVMIEKQEHDCSKETTDGESFAKKPRQYVPGVIFKKVTYDNLMAISELIDMKITYLEKLKDTVTDCKKFISMYSKNDVGGVKSKVIEDLKNADNKIVINELLFNEIFNELYYTM